VSQNSECKHTEAVATFMLYMNRLLAMSFNGGHGHIHVLYKLTSCHDL
jgi:hypothetical protein